MDLIEEIPRLNQQKRNISGALCVLNTTFLSDEEDILNYFVLSVRLTCQECFADSGLNSLNYTVSDNQKDTKRRFCSIKAVG